ncbi:MAG: DUF2878 domain-containing protein [Waddliaceae bacterium]
MELFEKLKYPINGLLFYFGWFAVVLYGASNHPLIAFALSLFVIILHFVWCTDKWLELLQVFTVVGIGFVVETALIESGFLIYKSRVIWSPLPPLWILGIYGILSTTLNYSLTWVKKIPFVAAVCGAIGGALSYRAGLFMGAVAFPKGEVKTLLVLGAVWFFLFPLICWVTNKPKAPKTPQDL